MSEPLRLTPDYYRGIDYEVLQESITNEIAWHVARSNDLGVESRPGAAHVSAVERLEHARHLVRPDNPDSMAVVATMLYAMRSLHAAETAA